MQALSPAPKHVACCLVVAWAGLWSRHLQWPDIPRLLMWWRPPCPPDRPPDLPAVMPLLKRLLDCARERVIFDLLWCAAYTTLHGTRA